jgi:hypothetical protein
MIDFGTLGTTRRVLKTILRTKARRGWGRHWMSVRECYNTSLSTSKHTKEVAQEDQGEELDPREPGPGGPRGAAGATRSRQV